MLRGAIRQIRVFYFISMKKNISIAITGGIGSGKSLASDFFEQKGFPLIRADILAKELMKSDLSIRKSIIKEFGNESFANENLNVEYLSKKVFSNATNVKKINSIVHPVTIKKIKELTRSYFKNHNIVFVESALVFEAAIRDEFDHVILICADENLRVNRVLTRDGVTEQKVKSIIANQLPDEKKKKLADFIIENNGTVADFESKCKFILTVIQSLVK